jgi:hypothetical protein
MHATDDEGRCIIGLCVFGWCHQDSVRCVAHERRECNERAAHDSKVGMRRHGHHFIVDTQTQLQDVTT